MIDTFIVLASAVYGPHIAQYLKEKKIDPRVALLTTSFVCAIVYTIFSTFFPKEMQLGFFSSFGTFTATSVYVYEFLLKNTFKK